MNKCNKSLGEFIRIMNSDINEINVVGYNNNYYVTESEIKKYMIDNNINDINIIMTTLSEVNNINNINILDESTNNSDLVFIKDIMMLYESLNPLEVVRAAKGMTLFRSFIDQAAAFIKGYEYSESNEIKKYIKECDKMLIKIAEEKELIQKDKNNSSVRFSAMYIANLAKNIFLIFFVPLMISNSKIKWPAGITKLFLNNGKKEIGKRVILSPKTKKVVDITLYGLDASLTLPSDIKGLYLSFRDYNKLLTQYETQIKNIRNNLYKKLTKLEKSKEVNSMTNFKESYTNDNAVEVLYQSPEELKIKNSTPEIVHDDQTKQMEVLPPDYHTPPKVEPEIKKQIPTQKTEPSVVPPTEFTPIDAINQLKCDPCTIAIAKYGDNYYIDHKDLKCYMDACGEQKYENALNNIITAHDDDNLSINTIKIIIGDNDLSYLDSKTKIAMENSNVEFEVYSI